MKKELFIEKLNEELEFEEQITANSILTEMDEWDSMSAMVLIGFVSDFFGITLTGNDLQEISTIDSLINKIGVEKIS
jgi:acyl carrier protein